MLPRLNWASAWPNSAADRYKATALSISRTIPSPRWYKLARRTIAVALPALESSSNICTALA